MAFVIAVKKQLSLSFYRFITLAVNFLIFYLFSFIVIANLSYRFIVVVGAKISYRGNCSYHCRLRGSTGAALST